MKFNNNRFQTIQNIECGYNLAISLSGVYLIFKGGSSLAWSCLLIASLNSQVIFNYLRRKFVGLYPAWTIEGIK